jgi:diaminohydroxyphosphoribosylaminopyrimidine deaminase/5-amino-6-(5-phosphoribosylamino)uracil reductase
MNYDEHYMKMALKLAQKGRGYVSPNPMVGAVIVKDGRIISQGYHQRYGDDHAEVSALKNAGEDVTGATLYVTLEPCSHYGKTPPCVNAIVADKIGQVVIGAVDANPLVAGRGINFLQINGIKVTTGILEAQCRKLNEVFFHYMETGLPFVTVKYAQTIDGRIATASGQSQWISSPDSRKYSHKLRAEHDAILVGAGTVIKDDPELTVRLARGRNPLRVILDNDLKIPAESKIFRNLLQAKTLIATTIKADDPRLQQIASSGAEIISVDSDSSGNVDLIKLFKILADRQISSILVEGGAQIITSVLKNNLAQRLVTIIAPKILGRGIEAIGDLQINDLSHAKKLSVEKIKRSGPDIIIDGRLNY